MSFHACNRSDHQAVTTANAAGLDGSKLLIRSQAVTQYNLACLYNHLHSLAQACNSLQAFYVPVAFVAIDLVTGKHWMSDVLGILVGHL